MSDFPNQPADIPVVPPMPAKTDPVPPEMPAGGMPQPEDTPPSVPHPNGPGPVA